jgi:DNA-directed RNA polymerase subunit beta
VNQYGFIETPYRRVISELKADDPRLLGKEVTDSIRNPKNEEIIIRKGTRIKEEHLDELKKIKKELNTIPVQSFVSDEIEYLPADVEDKFIIAQANTRLNEYNEFVKDRISCRYHSDFIFSSPEKIQFMDVAPNQIVGISAALIPFLEHDDANRALMGSNMQAQAVPLLKPDLPRVSTGMEWYAAKDSGQVLMAEEDGDVVSVTGKKVVVRSEKGLHEYFLKKYQRSNQSTCIDQRPLVVKGQHVQKGEILADSSSTVEGELALGQNAVVAFVSWEGGNYEDAILISERMVQQDKFTSIHIEKYELEARDTKLGPEEITRDIPNVGDDAIKDLDENGIVRIGAEVGPGDILVGKITPKGEKELTPEERLLRAIFGEKSRDVRDTSLRMPHGERGKVVEVKIFTRKENSDLPAGVDKMVRVSVAQLRKLTAGDKMAGRHGNKGVVSKVVPVEDMPFLEDGQPVDIILNPLGVPGRMNIGQVLETHLGWASLKLGFRALTPVFDGADEFEIEAELARAWLMDVAWNEIGEKAWAWVKEQEYSPEMLQDGDEVRLLYIEQWLNKKDFDIYQIKTDPIAARKIVFAEWLREKGYAPESILAFDDNEIGKQRDEEKDDLAINICLRIWLEANGKNTEKITDDAIRPAAQKFMEETKIPMPILGKQILRDGNTGIPYDQPVTVGVMTIMKLHHLVEDKVHARSTGPYSLVTQQPLGGKAQFGGQRFGEMEVWALEAYGAAYTLQEMLTIKSDDVQGRVTSYEAIVKGESIEEPSLPAGFRVLVKELQSLGLAVEAELDSGDVIKFGKDEEKIKPPKLPTGLLGLGEKFEDIL